MKTRTKIVATLGPATASAEAVRQLLEAGVDVFRLNASHGEIQEHCHRVGMVRDQASELGLCVGVLADLQGPKIRLGRFENGGCTLAAGGRFTLTVDEVLGSCERASVSYPELPLDAKAGDRVLLADGSVELRVRFTTGRDVVCEVVSGGAISDRKGINLPGVNVSTPALTGKDRSDLRSLLGAGIDMVALSFVRRRDDLLCLRQFLAEQNASLPIVAKIEKPEAWENLEEILAEADGVMVARGDLGVEVALEKVPFIQKATIDRARRRGRFVITATQMLESMVENATPTRAEVSDVFNAIWDGTDAVMLSAETSMGRHPVGAVRVMDRIAREADASYPAARAWEGTPVCGTPTQAEIIADAAYGAARRMNASAIVVFTATGASARAVARCRPPVPIYAFTPSDTVVRQLAVVYGVRALLTPDPHSTDEMMAVMDRRLLELGLVRPGDSVVFVAGQPIGIPGTTNMLRLHLVR